MCTDPMMYFDRRVSAYVLFGEWSILIMKTRVKTSTKRISVRQKWPNHGSPWSENINLASRELISAHVMLKGRHSLRFGAWVQRLAAWVSPIALRVTSFEFAHENSINIGGNASAGATVKPSTVKWFHLVPVRVLFDSDGNGKFGRLKYVFFDTLMKIIILYTPITHGPHRCMKMCW